MDQTTDDSPIYEYWNCPNCDCLNLDSRDVTVLPLCEECGESFEWIEVSAIDPDNPDD